MSFWSWARIGWVAVLVAAPFVARAQLPAEAGAARATLVYKDGDRVHGELIGKTATLIIFKSDRFGELRVPIGDAVIIKGEAVRPVAGTAAAVAPVAGPAPASAREREEEEKVSIWNWYYPAVLTARVRNFFGPWHGRLMFSNELLTDTVHRENLALDGKLARKFTSDTVELSARYDYDKVNGLPAADDLKGIASWRHDFTQRQFTQYRPSIEWDLGSGGRGRYVLLHQEVGYGFNVLIRPTRRARVGVSENVFDVWGSPKTPVSGHGSRVVPALFDEAELALPWRIALTQRGVWYPESTPYGWEDRVELDKKLTETLSVGVTHEIRRRNPEARDYERLKLLLGLDF